MAFNIAKAAQMFFLVTYNGDYAKEIVQKVKCFEI